MPDQPANGIFFAPHEIAIHLNEAEASLAAYQHPGDAMDARASSELVLLLADALTPVLQFIARGRLGGTLDLRAWVWLHETRLDLIGAESIEAYAKRRGVSAARIHELVREFRAAIPAYRSPNVKSATTRARMSKTQRERQVAAKIAADVARACIPDASANSHAP